MTRPRRTRVAGFVRWSLAVLGMAALLIGSPIIIIGLYRTTIHLITPVELFHYNDAYDAPPFAMQFRAWANDTYQALRLDLGISGLVILAVEAVFAGAWLKLVTIMLLTLWDLARNGVDAVRERATEWGPRGWIARLMTTLVLSGAASPTYAAAGTTRAAATAPQHPHHTTAHDHGLTAEHPVTPGDHTQLPPREPGVYLPDDIRPDCPRYRVHHGDTLSTIAERELGTIARWHDLARVNAFQLGHNPDHLEPGWEILLPPEAAPPNQDATKVITAAPGDTLWSISERELGTPNRWGQLWDLNLRRIQHDGLHLSLPDTLRPGWQIVVPDEPHNQPPAGFTPTAPVPSQDPFTLDPWPDPVPPAHENPVPEPGPATRPAPASAAPGPPAAPPTARTPAHHHTPQHDERSGGTEHGPRRVDGVEPAPGVFLGLGLAAAISLALTRARLRHHAKYTPGRPFPDYHPAPTVHALHRAHLNATHDPDTHEPHATEHTHPTEADRPAVRPTLRSAPGPDAPAPTPLPIELGVQHEQTVHLDVASCQGIGLSGPVEADAVRALLLQLLARHTTREQAPTPVVMTRADADLLLTDRDDPPSTIHLVDDLPEALQILEAASTTAPRTTEASTQDTVDTEAPHTVLVTRTPAEHAYQLYMLLRDRHGIAAVFLGPWPDGLTLTLDGHGLVTHATPASSHHLCGTRVFTATPQAGRDVLALTPTPRTPLPATPEPTNLFTLTYGHDPRPTRPAADETPPEPATGATRTAPSLPPQTPSEPDHTAASPPGEDPARTVDADVLTTPHASPPAAASDRQSTAEPTGEPAPATQARDPDAPPLRLHVFGGFRLVWTDPSGSEHTLTCTRGQRVLLTYLALHPHGIARETLLEQLFSEASQPTNTANTQLSRLRHHLHQATRGNISGIIDTTHHRFRLDPTLVSSDYAEFDHAATHLRHAANTEQRHQALHTLLRCHTGSLGADLDDYDWLTIPRYEADRLYINAIGELARIHVETDPEYTLHLLESALRDDPYNEALYRDIMRIQHQLDLAHTISRTYTLLTTRLAELDLGPEPHTTALAHQLLHHTSQTTS